MGAAHAPGGTATTCAWRTELAQALAESKRSGTPVLVDIDPDPATASRYGSESMPTVLMLDGDGRVLRTEGFVPPSGVLRFIEGN